MDGQELAQAKRARGWKFCGSLAMVGLGLLLFGIGLALEMRSGERPAWTPFAIGGGFTFMVQGAITAWRLRPGDRGWMSESPQRTRDRLQGQRARQLFLYPFAALIMLALAFERADDILAGEGRLMDYVWGLLPVLYAWVCTAIVMGWDEKSRKNRRLLEDELSAAIRAQAMTAAFLVLMTGATAALFLGLFRPALGIMALTVALATAGVTAGIRFAWLDREAGRGDG